MSKPRTLEQIAEACALDLEARASLTDAPQWDEGAAITAILAALTEVRDAERERCAGVLDKLKAEPLGGGFVLYYVDAGDLREAFGVELVDAAIIRIRDGKENSK